MTDTPIKRPGPTPLPRRASNHPHRPVRANVTEGRDIHVGADPSSGREYMVETFRVGGQVVERRLSTRPNPGCSWSPPIQLERIEHSPAPGDAAPSLRSELLGGPR